MCFDLPSLPSTLSFSAKSKSRRQCPSSPGTFTRGTNKAYRCSQWTRCVDLLVRLFSFKLPRSFRPIFSMSFRLWEIISEEVTVRFMGIIYSRAPASQILQYTRCIHPPSSRLKLHLIVRDSGCVILDQKAWMSLTATQLRYGLLTVLCYRLVLPDHHAVAKNA